jgi:hypothetical protein
MGTGVFMLVLGLAGTAVCAAAIRGRLRQAPVQAMLTNYTGYLLLSGSSQLRVCRGLNPTVPSSDLAM